METVKIALFGKMRSGKNTVADIMKTREDFEEFSFGEGIGNIIDMYFPTARANGKPRQHYQTIGQALRQLDKDVWINYTLASIHKYEEWCRKAERDAFVVIADGRQTNEAERLREEGFIIVKVECDEAERLRRIQAENDAFDPSQLNHETELQVDEVRADFVIRNDYGLEELETQVDVLLAIAYLSQLRNGDLSHAVVKLGVGAHG